jgi:intracellular sulfur oxidation DsrE/DsrF family protein
MPASTLTSNRRGFLGAAAAVSGTLVAGLGAGAKAAAPHTPGAAPAAATSKWDMSWVNRLAAAKHRMVFDAGDVEDGTVLFNAWTWLRDYNDVYQADSDMAAVMVIRHSAMPIILGDDIWSRLQLGMETKMKDRATNADLLRNPFINKKPEEGAAVDALIKRGVIVLGCNMALGNYVMKLAATEKIASDEARAQIMASLVPGVILMPSGIFAVARAQEAGCHYMRSS